MNKQTLRVWWKPQIPCKSFYWPVDSLEEGVKLLDCLAAYDIFQLENRIKPDFCNTGGIEVYGDFGNGKLEWCDWYDEESGEDNPKRFLETKGKQQ